MALVALRPVQAHGDDGAAAPSPRAAEALRLLQSGDPFEQQRGFLRLEALREPATVPAIAAYATARHPDVRAYALRALGGIQGVTAIPRLLEALRADRHPKVRRAALLALEPFAAQEAAILPAFLQALRDRKAEVRMTAIDVVSRIDDPQARDAILTRRKRERHRDVQRVLDLAMKRLGS